MPTFLNGPQHDFTIDRDREFVIACTHSDDETLSEPTLELIRAYTRRRSVPTALIPEPVMVGNNVYVTFTEEITGLLSDIAGENRQMSLKYRISAVADEVRRTLVCGQLIIGAVGSGRSGTSQTIEFEINTGVIQIGDAELEEPEDPDDPDPPGGDTIVLDEAVLWQAVAGGFVEAWESEMYSTWV